MSKMRLVFDTTDADTLAASDNVGAYIRSSDGTRITHTTEGLKEALDVYIAGGAAIEVDLDHTEDSVRLGNGTDFFTSTTVNTSIGLDVNLINASIEVTATDLDIRDLNSATDSISAVQSGTWTVDVGNTVTVQATDLDIRDLSAAQDSVESWLNDGAGNAITSTVVGPAQALDVNIVASEELTINDAALANTAILATATALAVANTSQAAVASSLADRKYLYLLNNANRTMFVGQSGVTAANGFPLAPQSMIELRAGAAIAPHFVTNQAGSEIRVLELA